MITQLIASFETEAILGEESLSIDDEIDGNLSAFERGEVSEDSWVKARAFILGQSDKPR